MKLPVIQDDGFLGVFRVPLSPRRLLLGIQGWVVRLEFLIFEATGFCRDATR